MSIPVIGISGNLSPATQERTAQYLLSDTYVQAVVRAGGLPVILPPIAPTDDPAWFDTLFAHLDGLLFSGGSDLDPLLFNGQPHPRVYGIDAARDTLEIALIRRAAQHGKPFLGICRGIQSVNVALGGTLYTDIADQFPNALRHDWYPDVPRDYPAHTVQITPESTLAHIFGSQQVTVNSLHHQGICQPAPALRVTAHAPDGLIEAVELPAHPFGVAVQWHPECLPESQPQRALFRAFIQSAAQ